MRSMTWKTALLGALFVSSGALAQQAPQRPTAMTSNPYAPYEWLIGDWYSAAGPEQIHQRLQYGPNRSYILYSTFTNAAGQPEKLHFEGIMVWNGKTKALDYLFAVEPGSGVQEKGTLRAQADGTVVREVEFTSPAGDTAHFRQQFWRTADNEVLTSLMRQTATGWELNFPGSDKIAMSRNPG